MKPERWQLIEELYHSASDLPDGQRNSFLQEACGEDRSLLYEVESLIRHGSTSQSVLDTPAMAVMAKAIAAANQFGARLAFLSIVPSAPSHTDEGVKNWQTDAYTRTQRRLTELADDAGLDTRPQLYVEFQSARPVSEQILETADKLRADLIIMGLHDSAHAGIVSHLDLATTYDVVCQAGSPVLTVNCSSEYDLRVRPTNATASPYPEAMGSAVTGLDRSDRRERESPSTR